MRIENKKMFVRGIVILLLVALLVILRTMLGRFSLRVIVVAGLGILAAVYHLVMALHIDGEEEEDV